MQLQAIQIPSILQNFAQNPSKMPLNIECGFTTTQTLFPPMVAVELRLFDLLKKKFISLCAEPSESDPCAAFLGFTEPNCALIEFGDDSFASTGLVGPRRVRQDSTALEPTRARAMIGPEHMCWMRPSKNGLPWCSE